MPSLYITVERERDSRSSREGARFRVKVRTQPDGHALLMSTRLCQSVAFAKREAEVLFGELEWKVAGAEDVRESAFLEIE